MSATGLDRVRAVGVACGLVAAAGCTTILGVDGDYGLDPAGSDGAGGAGPHQASASTGGGTSTGEGGLGVTSSGSASSGDQGGSSSTGGGEGGAGGTGAGGAGGGVVDCQEVFCGQEVPGGDLPASARNPRVSVVGGELRMITLVGDEGLVWGGRTEGGPIVGAFLDGDVVAEDAVPVSLAEVAILGAGEVTLGVESQLAGIAPPDGMDGVIAGVALDPPLFATRHGAEGSSTLYYVAASGSSSVFVACPEKTGRCMETGGTCTVTEGAPAHALSHQGNFVLLGRVCGDMRTAVVLRDGSPVTLPRRDRVQEIAVASGFPIPYVLTIATEGGGRALRIDSIDGDGVQTTFAPDVAPDARSPALTLTLPHLMGAWIEGAGASAVIRVVRCLDANLGACEVRRLHVPGLAISDPSALSMASSGGEVFLAWEEAGGEGVRLAVIPVL